MATVAGVLGSGAEMRAELKAPEEIREALGWQAAKRGESSFSFKIASEPANWPRALQLTAEWAADTPDFAQYPPEYVFRRLAWMEALALNATNPRAATELRAQRAELAKLVQQVRALTPGPGNSEGSLRAMEGWLERLDKALGPWLAESPAEQLEAFREEMKRITGVTRAELAKRHGGEQRLAEFVALSREHQKLHANLAKALGDRAAPEEARWLAVRQARAELGYFNGYNHGEEDWRKAAEDPDFKHYLELGGSRNEPELKVPDFALWLDEAEVARVLIEALALPARVELKQDTRTGRLALKLIQEGKVVPERTPWTLIEWPEGGANERTARELAELYDTLKAGRADFADTWKTQEGPRGRALANLAYALAAVDRRGEAVALLTLVGADKRGFGYKENVTPAVAVKAWELVNEVAGTNPTPGAWEGMVSLADKAGRTDELIARAARGVAEAPADSPEAASWQMRQGWALIAADNIGDGLPLLVSALETRPETDDESRLREWASAKGRLLQLAQALEDAGLAAEVEAQLVEEFRHPASPLWSVWGVFSTLAGRLMEMEKHDVVVALLRGRIEGAEKEAAADKSGRSGKMVTRESVMQLADALGRQGRHEDVLALLATSERLGSKDLSEMLSASGGTGWRPLAQIVAEALHAAGRDEEAAAILEAHLVKNGGKDPAYALYTQIKGAGATAFFDRLFEMDRYEERPLIWQASILLEAGKLDDAETLVKQAIAIDPSDGEQPKGDRMRAYAVLRQILLKKGDAAEAAFFEGVVAAIRRSEEADDLARAGLRARAIEVYQESLRSFADAYCIQSRLARHLAAEKRFDEAAEHYKRAFELMPDSFGRVESHCFGCERAFDGETAQAIAERVFTDLASKPGAKAQVYYLLGYLRAEQERWEEAAGYLTRAVSIDADYLNAWKKLLTVLPQTTRPRAETDRVVLRLLVLDPARRRTNVDIKEVRDLAGLWRSIEEAESVVPETRDRLYPLGEQVPKRPMPPVSFVRDTSKSTPELFARHQVVQVFTNALNAVNQWGRE